MQSSEDILKSLMQIMQLHMMYGFSRMGRHPIHPAQIPMVKWIAGHEGCTQADIAQHLNVKPSTVAISIRRLEAAGHIERKRNEADQRVWRVYLAEGARHSMQRLMEVITEEQRVMLRDFQEPEIAALRGYLQRIKHNLSLVIKGQERTECEEN